MPLPETQERARALFAWEESLQGRLVLAAQEALLRRFLAPWQAPGRSLLEIACGSGRLQPCLRAMGFDLTGCEPWPALRDACRAGLGNSYLVDPAQTDLLPYADGSFDYALLRLDRGTGGNRVQAALDEARRVASRGVALLLWNSCSLPALAPLLRAKLSGEGSLLPPLTALAAPSAARRLLGLREGRLTGGGALFLPLRSPPRAGKRADPPGPLRGFFEPGRPLRGPLAACLCALSLLRLDLPPARPLTARPLRVGKLRFSGPALGGCPDGMQSPSLRGRAQGRRDPD